MSERNYFTPSKIIALTATAALVIPLVTLALVTDRREAVDNVIDYLYDTKNKITSLLTTNNEAENEEVCGTKMAGYAEKCQGCPSQTLCKSQDAKAIERKKNELETAVLKSLGNVKCIIAVMSGKGGVGKSTVSVQTAFQLASRGYSIGLLDLDTTTPSVALMTNTRGASITQQANGWLPHQVNENLKILTVDYLLNGPNEALIWRGPKRASLVESCLTRVDWGKLDFLIIDTPPGTTDEHLTAANLFSLHPNVNAILVSEDTKVCLLDISREVSFLRAAKIPILGMVINNRSFKETNDISPVVSYCSSENLDLLVRINQHSELAACADAGLPVNQDTKAYSLFKDLVDKIVALKSPELCASETLMNAAKEFTSSDSEMDVQLQKDTATKFARQKSKSNKPKQDLENLNIMNASALLFERRLTGDTSYYSNRESVSFQSVIEQSTEHFSDDKSDDLELNNKLPDRADLDSGTTLSEAFEKTQKNQL